MSRMAFERYAELLLKIEKDIENSPLRFGEKARLFNDIKEIASAHGCWIFLQQLEIQQENEEKAKVVK